MKKNLTLVFVLFYFFTLYSQVGVNTTNPQGIFHVDAASNNPKNTVPSKSQQSDDFVISSAGVVSIGTTDPSPYSSLEIESDKGLRLPQLTTDQISTLDTITTRTTDKKGLMFYNLNSNCISFWNGTDWVDLCKCTPASGTIVINGPDPNPATVNSEEYFIATDGSNITNYVWKVNGVILQSGSDIQFSYTPTTTDTFTVSVTGYGCRNSSITTSMVIEVSSL